MASEIQDGNKWNSVIDIEEFIINSVQEKPYLYDAFRRDYKDIRNRENAFKSIDQLLGMQGNKCYCLVC